MPTTVASHLHLTPRDTAIVELVYAFHGCGVQHLHGRFWPPDSSPSLAYRRVALLVSDRYLIAFRMPSVTGQGSGKALLMVGPKGKQLLAQHLGVPLSTLPRQKHAASSLFVHHHFAICDFRVALELATERADVALDSWTGEWELKRTPMKVEHSGPDPATATRIITLIPDAAFSLAYRDQTRQGFLEMDMGTLATKRLQLKLRGYLLQQSAVPVPIFFVTHTERRALLIRQLAEREAKGLGADPTLIFVTTKEQVRGDTILTRPIWQQAGVGRPVALLPAESRPAVPSVRTASVRPSALEEQRL